MSPYLIAAIILVLIVIAYFVYGMMYPSDPVFLWDPTKVFTTDVNLAFKTKASGLVAAIPVNGKMKLAMANGSGSIYYVDAAGKPATLHNGPAAGAVYLPKTAVVGSTWGTPYVKGVALINSPNQYVCQGIDVSGKVLPGYVADGKCYISYAQKLTQPVVFDYLNMPL